MGIAQPSDMPCVRTSKGFSLLELLVVVSIIGVLSGLSLQTFIDQMKRSKRAEAITVLTAVQKAQVAYHAEKSHFSATMGPLLRHVSIPGSRLTGTNNLQVGRYSYSMARPWGPDSWECTAVGNVDSDPWLDEVKATYNRP